MFNTEKTKFEMLIFNFQFSIFNFQLNHGG